MVASGKAKKVSPVAAKATQSAQKRARSRRSRLASTRPRIDACRGGGQARRPAHGEGGDEDGLAGTPRPRARTRGDRPRLEGSPQLIHVTRQPAAHARERVGPEGGDAAPL